MEPFLIVGLGNPGGEYARTRHNIGFLVVDKLAERWGAAWSNEKKFEARLARAQRSDRSAVLCEPQTYMNSSGEAVGAVMAFYRVPLNQVLIVVDDADLPLGEIRMRPSGGTGGHHGLESVEQHLASRDYARLRIGIGRQSSEREITGHVLGRFSSTEQPLLDKVLDVASGQVECWLEDGIQKAMTLFNGAVNQPEKESKEQ